MPYTRVFVVSLVLCLILVASVALGNTITSTAAGGSWFTSSTWVGGVVPGASDDVVAAGPVTIAGVALCRNVSINPSGSVNAAIVVPPRTLRASGAITNLGSLGAAQPIYLDVEVGGDLQNAGTWINHSTRLIGSATRYLSQQPGHGISTDLAYASGASGDLIATTPVTFSGAIDLTAGRLILQPDCSCTLDAASFSGNMVAGGNELRFLSWSYLILCTIDDVVFVGGAKASNGVTVTTRLTVMDTLENGGNSGGGAVLVQGDLVNHGVIRNVGYSFPVRVTGDVENNGNIDCPQLELVGVATEHHLSMSTDALLGAPVLMPEFQASTLIADTPVRFGDGLSLGVGALVLQPGCSLDFVSFGGLGSGTIVAGGNVITVHGAGAVSFVTIDHGIFGDHMVLFGDNLCTGGLIVNGILESGPWADNNLTVDGTLENIGSIRNGPHSVRIRALGDLINHGDFTNARIVMAGTADQAVGAGPLGIAVPEFVIESGLVASNYQWYRNGQPLAGQTAADLTLSMIGVSDYGTYHCVADGESSRHVVIAETAETSSVIGRGASVFLAQNQPNPFHAGTSFAFSLAAATRVSLTVYDMAGRRVASLVDREMSAGRHDIQWQAENLPAGTYIYRLRAGELNVSRKCTLLN